MSQVVPVACQPSGEVMPVLSAATRRRRRHHELLWSALLAIVMAFMLRVVPGDRVALWCLLSMPFPETCPFRLLTHMDCPGCGLTRSFIHLSQGRISESLACHRVGWLIALTTVAQIPYRIGCLWTGKALPRATGRAIVALLIAVMLMEWVWRLAAR